MGLRSHPLTTMASLITIERYSHGVRLSGYSRDVFAKLAIFLESLKLKEPEKLPAHMGGGMTMVLKKRYYGLFEDCREAYIHRHHLPELLGFLKERGIPEHKIDYQEIEPPKAAPVDLTLYPHFEKRPEQVPIIRSLQDEQYSKRVDLHTGGGKTLSALWACMDMGERIVVMIPPKYFGIWIKALRETYIDIEQRYVTVSGSDELKGLMSKAVEGDFPWDVVLISSATYRAYLDNFEKWGQEVVKQGYEVPPPLFHNLIQAGVQINDEIQDDPGLVFRIDIFTNIRKQIYLSATPFTGSDFVTRMIDKMVPHHMGVPLPETPAYINVVGLLYSEPNIQKTDYLTPFKGTYNHARYETRMLKAKRRLDRYFRMVKRIVNGVYAKDREKGQKLLILCATVDFITALTKFLNMSFPDLQVGMHVSGSDYKKLLTNDITVSTIKSSGTGVDIPDLREVLMLQATDSKKDNIQVLGRLRKMKNFPETTPRFTYMICRNIDKHVAYHRTKTKYFDGRVKNHKVMQL